MTTSSNKVIIPLIVCHNDDFGDPHLVQIKMEIILLTKLSNNICVAIYQ